MAGRNFSIDTVLDALRRVQFGVTDISRRLQGDALARVFALDPSECSYRIVASGSHWRLRDYGGRDTSHSLVIVAAPIKRPYIWDLAPAASAIRQCLRRGWHVHLLEWMPASHETGNNGIDECTLAISECIAKVSATSKGRRPHLVGHSLGGTLAAICAATAPESIRGLVLLGAPLCFEPHQSRFRDALVALVPSGLSDAEVFPGSLLSHMSALASPGTFLWSRLMDAALSAADAHAIDLHARVERWSLDEVPLPGKLVRQIIDWLYRENRLCRGTLTVLGRTVGPSCLTVPTLAVVNTADEIAPLASVEPLLGAMATKDVRVITYPGETGVALQHLGVLVGREAYAQVWPAIASWLDAHG